MDSAETLFHTDTSPAHTLHQFSDLTQGLYNKKVEGIRLIKKEQWILTHWAKGPTISHTLWRWLASTQLKQGACYICTLHSNTESAVIILIFVFYSCSRGLLFQSYTTDKAKSRTELYKARLSTQRLLATLICCKTLGNSTGLSFPSMAAGSRPSPPYLNWTMNPSEFLTVRSYWEQRSSRD